MPQQLERKELVLLAPLLQLDLESQAIVKEARTRELCTKLEQEVLGTAPAGSRLKK